MSEHKSMNDDELSRALRGLSDVVPPPSIVPAVMRKVSEPAPVGLWSWLLRRRRIELRVSPVGVLAGLGAVAVALLALDLGAARRERIAARAVGGTGTPQEAAPANAEVVVVRFVLAAKGAKHVAVAGDFNGWDAEATVLEPVDTNGTFVAAIPLRKGAYEYMFVVDGQWLTDPAAAERRPDGFGRVNGVLRL